MFASGCGGTGGGYRGNISISCRKQHSNNTVKCSLEIGPISKTEAGEVNPTEWTPSCKSVAELLLVSSQKSPKNPSSGGAGNTQAKASSWSQMCLGSQKGWETACGWAPWWSPRAGPSPASGGSTLSSPHTHTHKAEAAERDWGRGGLGHWPAGSRKLPTGVVVGSCPGCPVAPLGGFQRPPESLFTLV